MDRLQLQDVMMHSLHDTAEPRLLLGEPLAWRFMSGDARPAPLKLKYGTKP